MSNLNIISSLPLSDEQIHELAIWSETYPKDASEEIKNKFLKSYRKVERENEEMINKYGSIQAWYESGEGRLIEFLIK